MPAGVNDMVQVVAALIWQDDKFLICQRPPHKARGLLWEFVGGKVEPGETKAQALIRECREELGIRVRVDAGFTEVVHHYPDICIQLTLFRASIAEGTLQKLEHNDIRWITPEEIPAYDFCPADEEILKMIQTEAQVQKQLRSLAEPKFQQFQSRLIPTVAAERVLGVRTPALRQMAKAMVSSGSSKYYLQILPHLYFEENNLHAFILGEIKDYGQAMTAVEAFLPYVDNWATCDQFSPKAFGTHLTPLYNKCLQWLRSEHIYTVRFGVGMLMRYYLGEAFRPEILDLVAGLRSEEYYINMMVAWFFATALVKQPEAALPYIEQHHLPKWTHNKAIQKAAESYRISPEQKAYLRTLKA